MQKESGKRESPYKGILRFAKEKKSQLSFAVVLSVLSSAFGVVPYIAVAVLLQKALENSLTTTWAILLPVIALCGYLLKHALYAKSTLCSHKVAYAKELFEEVNRDREEHGKKPFDDDDSKPPQEKEVTVSTTDPDSGVFHKGEHKKCFAYEAHTACDKHNFVLEVEVTPGNIHDSVAFDPLYDRLCQQYPEHKTVVADSAYKIPWICKRIFDSGRILSTAYKRPITKKDGLPWRDYVYDEYYDCVICPEYKLLHYATTTREGYRQYKSKGYQCEVCPSLGRCTENQKSEKTVSRHLWQEYIEKAEDIRHTPKYAQLYRMRKEKIERVFADAKEKHGMRYTQYRGLTQVSRWVKLKFAAMNLKKLATWKWKRNHPMDGGGTRFLLSVIIWFLSFEYKRNPSPCLPV